MPRKEEVKSEREALWRDWVEGCRLSVLSVKDYAAQNKICAGSLYRWSRYFGLSLEKTRESPVSFIEWPSVPHEGRKSLSLEVILEKGIRVKVEASWPEVIALVQSLV